MAEKDLFQEFQKVYEGHQPPFLLYEIANANENAHTNLLARLLEYKVDEKQIFLESFLTEVLGYKGELSSPKVTTQNPAIGNKDTGFVDLYIENNGDKIIIENKIKGAGDTKKQLARYIATALEVKNDEFEQRYAEWMVKISDRSMFNNIYVYYLTRNAGDDGPTCDCEDASLPDNLKEALDDHYAQISYQENILPWLKETVMPKIPYEKDGLMISALRQYIAYIEYYTETQDWQKAWAKDAGDSLKDKDDIAKYIVISKEIKRYSKSEGKNNDDCTRQFINALEYMREEIFRHDLDKKNDLAEWRLHYTPSFFILYKQSWADADERKYAIPSVYIGIAPAWHNVKEDKCGKRAISYNLNIDHLTINKNTETVPQDANKLNENYGQLQSPKFQDKLLIEVAKEDYQKDNWGNHNKQYRYQTCSLEITDENLNKSDVRCEIIKEIINNLKEVIGKIDSAINRLQQK